MALDRRTWIAAPLVFASGACALIYQVVWTRELRLVFGASTAASSAVVAIFAAGLGWGGLWFGPRIERRERPARFYAGLELGIAGFSALSPWLLQGVRALYVMSGGSPSLGPVMSLAVRLLLATLVLGPPTWLMGGTLPALARAVESDRDASRRSVAVLYAFNTLGAVLGAALATFVLLEQLGARAALYVTCAINVLVALVARGLAPSFERPDATPLSAAADGSSAAAAAAVDASRDPATESGLSTAASAADSVTPSAPARSSPTGSDSTPPPTAAAVVYCSAAIVGFAFFLLELVWYRMLAPLLGGSVFTFGLILAIALTGIGLGSLLYTSRGADRQPTLQGFALTCALEAAGVALPLALGDRLAVWATLLRSFAAVGFSGLVAGWTVIAACVVLPAALVAGYQFPLLIALLGRGRAEVSRDVGAAYAANTLGAVLGALCGGFGLLPLLGAVGTWRGVALLLAAWGGACALLTWSRQRTRWVSGAVFALVALTAIMSQATGPTAAWRHSSIGAGRVEVDAIAGDVDAFLGQQRHGYSWQVDGIESAIAINDLDGVSFIVNGRSDGNARADAATQVMGGLVGAALLPRVNKAMVVGLGTGSSAGWLGVLPDIERVDVAEIEPAIRTVARRSALVNQRVLDNPRVRIERGDARELLAVSDERYDLIFSEPSNPYRAGIASLYTREFYRMVAQHLAEQGLFVQWLQDYDVDAQTTLSILATLHTEFGHVETWNGLNSDLLLVASRQPLVHDADALRQRLQKPPFSIAMHVAWNTDGVEGFLAHFVANSALSRAAASSGVPLNTDDRPPVEYAFARSLLGGHGDKQSLYGTARARNMHRPALVGAEVDWERVDFERQAFALLGTGGVATEALSPQYRSRMQILQQWSSSDFAGALSGWNRLNEESGGLTPTYIERMALTELAAYRGDDSTAKLIDELARDQPTLRATMRGVWLTQRGQREQGLEALAAAFAAYRSDPWPLPAQMARALRFFRFRAETDKSQIDRWLGALSEPFAVSVNDSTRQEARVNLAYALGPDNPACIQVFAASEPYPPWTAGVLSFRAACYAAHKHPLADKAEREWSRLRAAVHLGFGQLLPPPPTPPQARTP